MFPKGIIPDFSRVVNDTYFKRIYPFPSIAAEKWYDKMKSKTALLVIDMLEDFIREDAPLEVPSGRDIIPAIQREIQRAHSQNQPVIYLCDRHAPKDPEFQYWHKHAVRGTKGAEIIPEIAPGPNDLVVAKTSYSGFFQSTLQETLKNLGVDKLRLTGVCTNICVLYTAADAAMRGFEVEVVDDATAALTDNDHQFALNQIHHVLKKR
jgi:nicotinamidase/pyrazinamidase